MENSYFEQPEYKLSAQKVQAMSFNLKVSGSKKPKVHELLLLPKFEPERTNQSA
jgi:hypothetical protein